MDHEHQTSSDVELSESGSWIRVSGQDRDTKLEEKRTVHEDHYGQDSDQSARTKRELDRILHETTGRSGASLTKFPSNMQSDMEPEYDEYNQAFGGIKMTGRNLDAEFVYHDPLLELEHILRTIADEKIRGRLQRVSKRLKSNIQTFQEDIQRLHSEVVTYQEKNQRLWDENDKNIFQNKTHIKERKKHKEEIEKIQNDKDKTVTELEKIKKDNDKTVKELKQKLSNEKANHNTIQKEYESKLRDERARVKAIEQNSQAEIKKWEAKNKRLAEENQSTLQSNIQAFQAEHQKQTARFNAYLKEQDDYWRSVELSLKDAIQKKEETIKQQKKDHENLLMSKLAGESLTMGNPTITDLSDSHRPTRLAEQFSEVFDNEWTDALNELTFESEEEHIEFLLKIMHRAYDLSMDLTATDWLKQCYYTIYEKQTVTHCGTNTYDLESDVCFEETEERTRKTYRWIEAKVPDTTLNETEQTAVKMFPHIKKKILTADLANIQKILRQCLEKEFCLQEETPVYRYAVKCGELCLLMCLRDPPVYIDYQKKDASSAKVLFDRGKYKLCTMTGKYVAYVVWPCLYLHKDGPLLSKGVAQGEN